MTIGQDFALKTRLKMQIFPWEDKLQKIFELKFIYNLLFGYLYLLDKQCNVLNSDLALIIEQLYSLKNVI